VKFKLLKLLALFLVLLAVNGLQALAQSKSVFGVYKHCAFTCRFLKINPDFTFEQLLDGDLFNNQRTEGKWQFIGANKIKAETSRPSGEPNVKETTENRNNFLIIVVDSSGAVVSNAEISVETSGEKFRCITSQDGSCEIPKSDKFDVAFASYRGTHKVKDAHANVFTVELTYDKLEPIIDDVWLIENECLYVADKNGEFRKDTWYEKVSGKRAKKIFP
jgi:hypothetical protein